MRNLFITAIPACTLTLNLALATNSISAAEESEISWRTIEVGLLASTHSLEGPAVTGPMEEQEAEDEGGFGIYSRMRYGFADYFHITADLSAEQIASDVSLVRGVVAPGVHWDFAPTWSLYGEAGIVFAVSDGLKDYDGKAPEATDSDGGSEVGFIGQVGLRNRPFTAFEWHVSLGYMTFGETTYEGGAGSSSGDGPIYELGASYDLTDSLALALTWQGTWVEDSDIGFDLATQQVRLGTRFNF